jgi:surface antigen
MRTFRARVALVALGVALAVLLALPTMAFAYPASDYPNVNSAGYLSPTNPFAASGYSGQCTWFVWGRTYEKLGIALGGSHGGAETWYGDPGLAGYTHNPTTPLANSIACWGGGHVAFIEEVIGSNVVLNEAHVNGVLGYYGQPETVAISAMQNRSPGSLQGYIYVGGTSPPPTYTFAFQANTGNLYTAGTAGVRNWGYGMMHYTTPSVVGLTNGNDELAFQANTGNLWSVGSDAHGDWKLGMMAGTSPAIAGLAGGGYEVTFQANSGDLWSIGAAGASGHGDWKLGMKAGTNPAVCGLGSGYELAFQANTGNLWSVGSDAHGDWKLGMMAGTSPAIAGLAGGGYEVAFQANSGDLWSIGAAGASGHGDWKLGMMAGTSPAVCGLSNGGYEIAFQANTGDLYTVGTGGSKNWRVGMMKGTSPVICALSNGSYEVAFQANTGNLYTVGSDMHGDWGLGMMKPDLTPPATAVSGADSRWHRTAVTLTFKASDNPGGSGMSGGSAMTQCKVGSGTWTRGTNVTLSAPATHADDGIHTVNYRSCDAARNLEATRSVTVRIDTTGPTTSARATSGRKGHAIVLRYRVTDALSPTGTAVRIIIKNSHGKVVKSFACATKTIATWYSVKWTPLARGTFRYSVYAKDLAGNAQVTVGSAKVVVR